MSDAGNRRDLLKAAGGFVVAGVTLALNSHRASAVEQAEDDSKDPKITSVTAFKLLHQSKWPFGVSVSVPVSRTRAALIV